MTVDPPRPLLAMRLQLVLLAAPVIFVAHVLEEAPTFVSWVNTRVTPGITQEMFWIGNSAGLGITLAVIALEWLNRSRLSATVTVAWLSFVMLGNAVLHGGAAIIDGAYVPGLVTALLLYVPFWTVVVTTVIRARRLSAPVVVMAATLGALPMLAHGYLIAFRGSRLF